VNDYTKNISQSIFSPGLLDKPHKAVKEIYNSFKGPERKRLASRHEVPVQARPNTNIPMMKRKPENNKTLVSLEKKLLEESEKKKRLRRDIDDMKSELSKFKELTDRLHPSRV
jgi:hypothetical protein